jgi:putative DNA methylase
MLFNKEGKEAYVEPVIGKSGYRFTVRTGKPKDAESTKKGSTAGKRNAFRCLISNVPITYDYIRQEGKAGRMGERLMAIVAESEHGRVYLSPFEVMEAVVNQPKPEWAPENLLPENPRDFKTPNYGLTKFSDLFTSRQLLTLTTFSDLVQEARERAKCDAQAAGRPDDGKPLAEGGTGATAYADAVGTYLGLAVSKETVFLVTQARWRAGEGKSAPAFGRQALPMVWDFADLNPFAGAGGDFKGIIEGIEKTLQNSPTTAPGNANQANAATQEISYDRVVSTDPPYYENIGYADLSDFFYVWLRHTLKPIFPALFSTLAVPKADELVATPYRHGSKENAEIFFLGGMTKAMSRLAEQTHPAFPVTIYYAFKQSESDDDQTANTGWDTFLEAVIRAGFAITGTWPMRTENKTRLVGMITNALASSIILVCCKRETAAPTISRREFLRELNAVLPEALLDMTQGGINSPVAPVDLSQAIIGPGMAIFSKYAAVLEADGKPMTVRTALQLINRFLAEDDFDHDTQFCMHWFDQNGWAEGNFGEADVLARAKGSSVRGVSSAGIIESGKGIVRLLRYSEYPSNWSPDKDSRKGIWEALHHLIRALQNEGESSAGGLLARIPSLIEPVRQLAYRLYTLCERKGWAEDARAYNELIASWQAIEAAAAQMSVPKGSVQIPISF